MILSIKNSIRNRNFRKKILDHFKSGQAPLYKSHKFLFKITTHPFMHPILVPKKMRN